MRQEEQEEQVRSINDTGIKVDALIFTICEMDYEEVPSAKDVTMRIETPEPVVDNLVVNHRPIIPHPEPPMEKVSQEEIIQTNKVAMSADITSELKLNQVSVLKRKVPLDISKNMIDWNKINSIDEFESQILDENPWKQSADSLKTKVRDGKNSKFSKLSETSEEHVLQIKQVAKKIFDFVPGMLPSAIYKVSKLVQTNEMATMSVYIPSELRLKQVLKRKVPVDISENMVDNNSYLEQSADILKNVGQNAKYSKVSKTSKQIATKMCDFVPEMVPSEIHKASESIVQNQQVLAEKVAQEVQVASAGNNVQNVTMEYQDITGKNYQKKFSVYRKAPVTFTFKNALVLVQYNGKASTNQINTFYKTMFPYYCTAGKAWMNNARRNLSEKNGYFKKTGEAATKIKGQRGPQGEFWTFSDKKEKLKKEMTKVWKESKQDIKSSTPYPDLVETLFKKVLALKTSGIDAQKKSKRKKQCLSYYQLAVLAIKDSSKNDVIVDDVFKFCKKLLSYYKDQSDKDWTKNLRSVIAKATKRGLFVAKGKNGEKGYTLAPEKKESEYRNVLEFCQKNEAKIKSKMCDPEMFEMICK